MKLLDKLIFRELVPTFWQGVALFTVLVFAAGPLLEASKYLAQGVPPSVILALVGLKLLWVIGLTFPMGTLLAMLIGYGRLSDESEAVALFAGGIPFLRVAVPAAVLGLAASLVGFLINDKVTAEANAHVAAIHARVLHDPGETSNSFNIENRKQGVLMAAAHIEKGYDAQTKSMRQVLITFYDGKNEDPALIVHAKRGQWQGDDRWILFDGLAVEPKTGQVHLWKQLKSADLPVPVLSKTPADIAFLSGDLDTLDFHQLFRKIEAARAGGVSHDPKVREAEVDLWSKLALPMASLVFALVGAPLGLRPVRSPKQTGWILAVFIIFCYYVLYMLMRTVATGGYCPPVLAMFLPNLIGLFAGLSLIRRTA